MTGEHARAVPFDRGADLTSQASIAARAAAPELRDLRVSFGWLLRLRYSAIAGQAITIVVAHAWLHAQLPLSALFTVIGIELASNLAFARWLRSARSVAEWMLGALMAFDVLLLTLLLYLTGGVHNPFSFLYLVHIALAAVVLRDRWTWTLVGLSFLCLGLLFLDNVLSPISWLEHPEQHAHHIQQHLQGMWVAFGIAAAFIVYFVTRVTRDLTRREAELSHARAATQRAEKLASLATLAAGAAHELGTPLSTIAVVARELERSLEHAADASTRASDARLIRGEVQRCREILDHMAEQAGQTAGEAFARATARELLDAVVSGLAPDEQRRVELQLEAPGMTLHAPVATLTRALRGLIKNALQASEHGRVVVGQREAQGSCELEVSDSGAGMTEDVLARAGEPFFTTKAPGQGMGLGLFLARAVAERLGGTLEVRSRAGEGTEVVARLPLAAAVGTGARS